MGRGDGAESGRHEKHHQHVHREFEPPALPRLLHLWKDLLQAEELHIEFISQHQYDDGVPVLLREHVIDINHDILQQEWPEYGEREEQHGLQMGF